MSGDGDLSRDGAADFDGDGSTDLAEFRAGTNPADNSSVFRAFTLSTPDPANGLVVLWSAVSGRTYRVQYKNGIEDPVMAMLYRKSKKAGTA